MGNVRVGTALCCAIPRAAMLDWPVEKINNKEMYILYYKENNEFYLSLHLYSIFILCLSRCKHVVFLNLKILRAELIIPLIIVTHSRSHISPPHPSRIPLRPTNTI